jgi:hypothetical protein
MVEQSLTIFSATRARLVYAFGFDGLNCTFSLRHQVMR